MSKTPNSQTPHDGSHSALFSHPRMAADLLRGFVKQDSVKQLDFSTLERHNGNYVTPAARRRHEDVVWRIRFKNGQWLYLYILLEFQSSVDAFMAVRITAYTTLFWLDLIKTEQLKRGDRLPPVLPIVLYNGKQGWNVATELSELIHPAPEQLQAYQPRQQYLLLDEKQLSQDKTVEVQNLAAAFFQLEYSHNETELLVLVERLSQWLDNPDNIALQREFLAWLKTYTLVNLSPEQQQAVNNLTQVKTMLADKIQEWQRDWERRSFAAGQEQGIEQNHRLLCRQAQLRFDAKTAEQLAILLQANTRFEPLAEIVDLVMQCNHSEDFLQQVSILLNQDSESS